jgi:alpha-beta hydrolase superfamily lysophospholipase
VGHATDGRPVVEHPIELGPHRLFGIVTEGPGSAGRPAVVLVNEGGTHHIGQARTWVDLARRLGANGFRVLRFDLSGNGDSGTRPGQRAHVARAPEAIDDVSDAMAAVSPDDPDDVVLVGFCSGGYQVVEQALATTPRGICVINPSFAFDPPEPAGTASRPARQTTKPWLLAAAGPALTWLRRHRPSPEVERLTRAVQIGTWPAAVATRHPGVPESVWRVVTRLTIDNPGVSSLERVAGTDTDTLLIAGSGDYLPIALGAERRIRALEQEPNFKLVRLELDHASWAMAQRHLMMAVIGDHVLDRFGGPRPETGA